MGSCQTWKSTPLGGLSRTVHYGKSPPPGTRVAALILVGRQSRLVRQERGTIDSLTELARNHATNCCVVILRHLYKSTYKTSRHLFVYAINRLLNGHSKLTLIIIYMRNIWTCKRSKAFTHSWRCYVNTVVFCKHQTCLRTTIMLGIYRRISTGSNRTRRICLWIGTFKSLSLNIFNFCEEREFYATWRFG